MKVAPKPKPLPEPLSGKSPESSCRQAGLRRKILAVSVDRGGLHHDDIQWHDIASVCPACIHIWIFIYHCICIYIYIYPCILMIYFIWLYLRNKYRHIHIMSGFETFISPWNDRVTNPDYNSCCITNCPVLPMVQIHLQVVGKSAGGSIHVRHLQRKSKPNQM